STETVAGETLPLLDRTATPAPSPIAPRRHGARRRRSSKRAPVQRHSDGRGEDRRRHAGGTLPRKTRKQPRRAGHPRTRHRSEDHPPGTTWPHGQTAGPKEPTSLTMMDFMRIHDEDWKDASVRRKIAHVLWVPYVHDFDDKR